MKKMKVLVIGSGGREHALTWKIKQSPLVEKIFCAPGNAGTDSIAENVPNLNSVKDLADFAQKNKIDLTVVGPENFLVEGIVDFFEKKNLKCFGPRKNAAVLEGSKVFCREFLKKFKIPMPDFKVFSSPDEATEFVKKNSPIVIKADGLAAGKGVIVAKTPDEAVEAVETIMVNKKFGNSGEKILCEEMLEGEEASYIVFSDGKNFVPMASSQDHKRIFDNDKGPNTGGMGAYSPAPIVSKEVEEKILKKIIKPTIRAMYENNREFKGILYAGLMIKNNEPKLIEFNCRFGDPEAQAVLPRFESDIVELMLSCIEGNLSKYEAKWSNNACTTVVLASGGYPENYEKNKKITGLKEAGLIQNATVFHAGTKKENEKILTSGGRVLNVSALGENISESIKTAYTAVEKIHFDKMFYRKDIGKKALVKL